MQPVLAAGAAEEQASLRTPTRCRDFPRDIFLPFASNSSDDTQGGRQTTMIITIDGPAGAGKSTAARALAIRLGFEFLDTGAMYRAVALAALRANVSLRDEDALRAFVVTVTLEIPPGKVLLNG